MIPPPLINNEKTPNQTRNASLISKSFLESTNKTDTIESLTTGDILKVRERRNSCEKVNLRNSFLEVQKDE
jgi:hypothetical protein